MEPHYKKLRRVETLGTWRFLTFSCYHKLPLLDQPHVRDRLADSIRAASTRCSFRLRAWVIMPNHVHILLRPTSVDWPVPKILRAIKQSHAQTTLREWQRASDPVLALLTDDSGITKYWQPGGGFDRNVRDEQALAREIQYIHDNPVRRRLASDACDWAWSSANWYAGVKDGQIPIDS